MSTPALNAIQAAWKSAFACSSVAARLPVRTRNRAGPITVIDQNQRGLCVLGPIRPNVGAAVATARADHALTERPDDRLVRQVVGVHFRLVIAGDRIAVDEQIPDAMATDVAHRDGLE
jgi:hypothetical protein